MLLLAVETSSTLGGIALLDDSRLLAESRYNVSVQHSEQLLLELDRALHLAGAKVLDIDVFAINSGPGSFTGLRVGMSVVKGLAYASSKPIVSVSALHALAYNVRHSHLKIVPLIDARKNLVFTASFISEGGALRRLSPDTMQSLDELTKGIDSEVLFVGDAVKIYKDTLAHKLQGQAHFADAFFNHISPAVVGFLALKEYQAGMTLDPIYLFPSYIRKSEAELKLTLQGK